MTASVQKDRQGPVWPLGNIAVATPGTPVNIMSLVDSGNVNDPGAATSTTSDEYAPRANAILFQACKAGGSHGLAINTGLIYILKKGAGSGTGNRDDLGSIIAAIPIGAATTFPLSFLLQASPLNRNVLNPYEYFIDAENAADGCQVTLFIQ